MSSLFPPKEKKDVVLGVAVSPALRAKVAELAAAENTSMSEFARTALEFFIDQHYRNSVEEKPKIEHKKGRKADQ